MAPTVGPAPWFVNPVITDERGEDHGDPFVLAFHDGYYLYHTTEDGREGISVHRSTDLVRWTFEGFALEPAGSEHWAQIDLWAPEVMYREGMFYMYVSGALAGPSGRGLESSRRQGLARARSPLGPFVLDDEPLVGEAWSIDGHPFRDEDGTLWLFYNTRSEATRYRGMPGSGTVVDRLLTPGLLEGAPTPVSFPSQAWEGGSSDAGYWNEGSWVLKRRGDYFQLYSGGDYRDSTYGIGLTQAATPRGPWHKDPSNPIFRSGHRITGPGHHSIILAPDGVTYYSVYHGYDGRKAGRKVHLDRLAWAGDRPIIGSDPLSGRPTEGPQSYPPRPVLDGDVPYWHADLWVQGSSLSIDGVQIGLSGAEAPWRVRASQGRDGLRVWVDGLLQVQQPGIHAPEASSTGRVSNLSLTSHLSDETVRWLPPGERHTWPWGGRAPVEISVAVRGAATLRAGAQSASSPPESRFCLLHLLCAQGTEEISIEGELTGAHVTDLSATAR